MDTSLSLGTHPSTFNNLTKQQELTGNDPNGERKLNAMGLIHVGIVFKLKTLVIVISLNDL